MSKVNDENGATKMTWNSPFQPLNTQSQPQSQLKSHYDNEDYTTAYNEAYNEDYNDGLLIRNDLSENHLNYSDNYGSGNFGLSLNHLPTTNIRPAQFNTDIPVLDDLFSELNSDLNYFDPTNKSEPVNIEDIERILLPTNQPARKPIIRQPFSSILSLSTDTAGYANNNNNNVSNTDYYNNLPTGPFDDSLMLWDGLGGTGNGNNAFNPAELSQKSLIPLNSQTSSSQIQIKVIGKRPSQPPKHNNLGSRNEAQPRIQKVPYVPAPPPSKPMKSYRTYGSKRYIIGPEYADFVSRLQNDIPFDSSEDDEDEQFEKHSSSTMNALDRDTDDNSDNESSDEEEEGQSVKISSQELLELFEDSCSGLPGLISAFLTHRKHQIGLKGYKPRASTSASMLQNKTASAPPLLAQDHFDRIRKQLSLHFQFLIQNLALSNEIEGGEGITLVSLKLLVQLHLSLDSICNLRPTTTTTNTTITTNTTVTTNTNAATSSSIPSNISCLNLPAPRVNPIRSRLNELVPAGIKKVSIIAGFLVRPGQKQFLSLAALRADSSLRPKTSLSAPPLGLKIKNNPNSRTSSGEQQLLSNAFYNILALFHDYIDARLLEQTVGAKNLIKHLDISTSSMTSNTLANNSESQPIRTAKFLASEDNLLLSGLHRFGCGNWESIQCQFLPFRTARQLAIRYKNLSSRREPMNPIKEFNENLMMPLSEIEEDLLGKGVQRFGNQFHLISKHYLPHRPATVLGKLWKAMDDARTRSN